MPRFVHGVTGLLLLLLFSCAAAESGQTVADSLSTALRQQLQQTGEAGDTLPNLDELRRFYLAEAYRPAWIGGDGPNHLARLLRARLLSARNEGLLPQHYLTGRIEALWPSSDVDDEAQLELVLSSAFITYVREIRGGRLNPQQVAPLWEIETTPVDGVDMLRLALYSGDFEAALDALPPSHPQYRRLRNALARYRQIEMDGGWPLIAEGPSLKVGMQGPRVAVLRKRLAIEGDLALPGSAGNEHYDGSVAYAVERFQVRHGLKVDGVVGRQTLAAMNVPVAARIEQIELTMERWRWLPQHLGRRHIIVNIPAYKLVVYEDDEARMSMPVIIGTQERPTPAASGLLHTVVFNPFWTVPRKIALQDLVPRQRSNPDYLARHHIRVFADWNGGSELDPRQIDWKSVNVNHFPYMLRQDPGPRNALGQVKFLFSNRFSVYLHDTPDVTLFADDQRAYSSGCIRVEEPLRLASFLLKQEEGLHWNESTVRATIDTKLTREVPLVAPIQVYLLYLTAWVGEDGAVDFLRDVYGEDALLAMCMPYEEQSP